MKIEFAKLNGLGNDFVFINDMDRSIEISDEEIVRICDRHFGIGADGVIMVRPSDDPECAAYMHYINSDSTLAQMCGNGVRCFAKYLVDRDIVDPRSKKFIAGTLAGPREISFETDECGKMTSATVDMGVPILNPETVPVDIQANNVAFTNEPCGLNVGLDSPWGTFAFTFVSMGNPHAVCFIDDWDLLPNEIFVDSSNKSLDTLDLDKVGSYFENHRVFPEKANIEFAQITDNGIQMRVYERGCAETLACGTGACATCVAAVLTSRAEKENDVFLKGGKLHILWADDGDVYMSGPAEQSYIGQFELL